MSDTTLRDICHNYIERQLCTKIDEVNFVDKKLTSYQRYARNILVSIGGIPQFAHHLKNFGVECKVWVWLVGDKRRHKILVMADKAQDLGLKVDKISVLPDGIQPLSPPRLQITKYELTEDLNLVRRVNVWCPEHN